MAGPKTKMSSVECRSCRIGGGRRQTGAAGEDRQLRRLHLEITMRVMAQLMPIQHLRGIGTSISIGVIMSTTNNKEWAVLSTKETLVMLLLVASLHRIKHRLGMGRVVRQRRGRLQSSVGKMELPPLPCPRLTRFLTR